MWCQKARDNLAVLRKEAKDPFQKLPPRQQWAYGRTHEISQYRQLSGNQKYTICRFFVYEYKW